MSDHDVTIPTQAIPLLPLIRGVIFPHTITTIPVGRPKSVRLVETLTPGALVAVGVQTSRETRDPGLADLHPVATLARVQQLVRMTNGGYRVILRGLDRVLVDALEQSEPFWTVRVSQAVETGLDDALIARAAELREHVQEIASRAGGSLGESLDASTSPGELADRVASELGLDTERRAAILDELDLGKRLDLVSEAIGDVFTRSEVKQSIEEEVRKQFGKNQREAILREQLKAIKKELGEGDGEDAADSLRDAVEEANLPEEVRKVAERELSRMEAMNPAQAEYGVIRNYLEWLTELPWLDSSDSPIDIDEIERKLAADHHGLVDVKDRLLEHMAVMKISGNVQGTILCLAGPPGVGKTSLAQSVADAIDRPLVRISLGGVRDEAEIRGHRRTYVGALPGRVMNAMRKAGVNDPVVVLDEIDKLGNSWMGSPDAALLELLDPEQNDTFTDHYVELPFDLSKVVFICTANDLSQISGPLRDRLEIIEVSGYTPDEKVAIAQNHLLPRRREGHGLPEGSLTVTDDAIRAIATSYTREAGVRQLDRKLTKLCRAATLALARATTDEPFHMTVGVDDLEEHLGRKRFYSEVAARTALPGVATGLAWTPMGGDILFIETTSMPGKGRLELTGQLGDVMKESARAALAFVRTHAAELGIDEDVLESRDIHLHIPAGAVPKDGPSAGVTIFTALTSLLTGRRVRPDTAMTGEASLRGKVLPVGGIKAKVLAAHRAGIKRVILPERNRPDLEDVPDSTLADLEVIFATEMREVLAAALAEPGEIPVTADLTDLVEEVTPQGLA
jgi:ATP-dependent Lon protease